jgi:hypothetical protein
MEPDDSAPIEVPRRFKKRLHSKPHEMQGAIARTMHLLLNEPTRPGLNVHRVQGQHDVWEAYIDQANRITFHRVGHGRITFLNHCNHTLIDRGR